MSFCEKSYLKNAEFRVLFSFNLQVERERQLFFTVYSLREKGSLGNNSIYFSKQGSYFQPGAHMFQSKPNTD